jgi:hypothetical protein
MRMLIPLVDPSILSQSGGHLDSIKNKDPLRERNEVFRDHSLTEPADIPPFELKVSKIELGESQE